jgi:hypothetical protein
VTDHSFLGYGYVSPDDAIVSRVAHVPVQRSEIFTDRARQWMKSHPDQSVTAKELGELAGITCIHANSAVTNLLRRGEIVRLKPVIPGRRQKGQRYQWGSNAQARG